MRIGGGNRTVHSHYKTNLDLMHLAVYRDGQNVPGFQMVLLGEIFADRNGDRSAQPFLQIEILPFEIGKIKGPKRFVGENINAKNVEIFTGKLRQRKQSAHDGRRRGNACLFRDDGKNLFG